MKQTNVRPQSLVDKLLPMHLRCIQLISTVHRAMDGAMHRTMNIMYYKSYGMIFSVIYPTAVRAMHHIVRCIACPAEDPRYFMKLIHQTYHGAPPQKPTGCSLGNNFSSRWHVLSATENPTLTRGQVFLLPKLESPFLFSKYYG